MDAELDDDKDSRFEFMAKLFAQMLIAFINLSIFHCNLFYIGFQDSEKN